MHPRGRLARRRRLPLDRRRRDLEQRRPGRHPPHRPHPHPPGGPGPGLRGRARPRLRSQRAARRVPLARRRRHLGARAPPRRRDRRHRPGHRPHQPASPVRRALAGDPPAVDPRIRRPRQRHLQVHRRRRHLDGDLGQPRPAGGHQGPHRHRLLARQTGTGLGDRRGGEGRAAALRGRRRQLGGGQHRARVAPAPLVLPPRVRRPAGRRHRVGAQPGRLEVHRRRQDLHRGVHPARRQPRPVDRPGRPAPHDRGQRRRRLRLLQRRRHLVDDLQPADLAVLPPHHRHAVPVPGVRHAAGQLRDQRAQPLGQGHHPHGRLLHGRQLGERPHPGPPRQPQHRLLRRHRQRPRRRRRAAALRPRDRADPHHHRLAGGVLRLRSQGPQVPLPVDVPDPDLAPRPRRALHRRQRAVPLHRRRRELGGDQPRPDPRRPDQAGGLRRPDHQGHHRRRALLHDLRLRRVHAPQGAVLGRLRRRAHAPVPRRRRELAGDHAARASRVVDRGHDRAVPAR